MRERALCLSQGLFAAQEAFRNGERRPEQLLASARETMAAADRIQYLDLVDAQTLESLSGPVDRTSALCVAAYVGATRLIDKRCGGDQT